MNWRLSPIHCPRVQQSELEKAQPRLARLGSKTGLNTSYGYVGINESKQEITCIDDEFRTHLGYSAVYMLYEANILANYFLSHRSGEMQKL